MKCPMNYSFYANASCFMYASGIGENEDGNKILKLEQ